MVRQLLKFAGVAEIIKVTGRKRERSSTCHFFRADYMSGTAQSTPKDPVS